MTRISKATTDDASQLPKKNTPGHQQAANDRAVQQRLGDMLAAEDRARAKQVIASQQRQVQKREEAERLHKAKHKN
ncbi:MAG: hypothetical protein JO316_15795 [Abitibacteriaceae bacterium]|nr:hypothetical protein [Abditibacteriaceae bacterium]